MTDRRIRVLLVCLTRRGGLLHFNDCLADGLSRVCDVRLICAANAEHGQALPDIDLRTIDTGKGAKGTVLKLFSPRTWKELRRLSDEFRPDIIHVTSAQEWNPALGLFIRRTLKKPLIYTIHDVIHHEGTPFYFRVTESLFRKMPDGFVVLTDSGKKILTEKGIPEDRVLTAPHGVYDFFTQYASPDIREENEILFFGRIEPYKGVGVLLEAARPLLDEYPDWNLHIAGGGDLTPYTGQLEHPRIRVTNRFLTDEEVAHFMQRASIAALPYLSASQSGVIPTAYAFGKAVVASAVGGIPDMVRHEETGLLVPPNDPEALRTALRTLIKDPDLRARLGKAGKAFAADELSWGSIAQKHAAFYERFLK